MWWVARLDWAALRDSYRRLPDRSRRVLALLLMDAMFLNLQSAVLLVVARDEAIPSIVTGGLLAVTTLILALRWPGAQ
jgi:hypothetical protein